MSELVVTDIAKSYSSPSETLLILDGVSFKLTHGEDMSIVGASGSGKSTLLYILGTLDHPTAGEIRLDQVAPFQLSATALAKFRNDNIGFVFQDHHLLPQLTVVENVLLPALASGSPSSQLVERANELIAEVGLEARANHLPGQLSGGERQRVAVARALLKHPKLILADEPTGNLDTATSDSIADILFSLPKREGAMLIVVTHNQGLAERSMHRMQLANRKLVEVR